MFTIMRHLYGCPLADTNLCDIEDCFLFYSSYEAEKCLRLCFNNGAWLNDDKYGKCRYYIEEV